MKSEKMTFNQFVESMLDKDIKLAAQAGKPCRAEDLRAEVVEGIETLSHIRRRKSYKASRSNTNKTTELEQPLKTGVKIIDQLESKRVFTEKKQAKKEDYEARKARSDRIRIYAI